jgi:hypothetical protein
MPSICHRGWHTSFACSSTYAAGWFAARDVRRYYHQSSLRVRNRSGRGDAFLHVVWAAVAYLPGGRVAFNHVLAHENDGQSPYDEGRMDTQNDWIGLYVARYVLRTRGPHCAQLCAIRRIPRIAYHMAQAGELETLDWGV